MALETGTVRTIRWRPQHPVLLALTILLAPALWILFVGTLNPHELLVGLAAACATICFTVFVCRSSSTELSLRSRDVLQLWRSPWYILSGALVTTVVFFKDLFSPGQAQSLYRVCGFDTSTHDPVRAARTILAVAYTTISPNFIIIGIDPAQSRMLFHQIEPSDVPQMTKALGARP